MWRLFILMVTCAWAGQAQNPDPAYDLLTKAYAALAAGDYDNAIAYFVQALPLDPTRTDFRQDLGYTYIDAGNDPAALGIFAQVMQLDPSNDQAALQFAFLAYEQGDNDDISKAHATFDLVRRRATDPTLQATAETAFGNVDGQLATNIAFYSQAILLDPLNYLDHQQLANFSEQRGDNVTAAREFQIALATQAPSLYLDYARVLGKLGDIDGQTQALQAVVNASDPFVAEQARDQLAALSGNVRSRAIAGRRPAKRGRIQ